VKEARKRDENATNTTRGISCKVLGGVWGDLPITGNIVLPVLQTKGIMPPVNYGVAGGV